MPSDTAPSVDQMRYELARKSASPAAVFGQGVASALDNTVGSILPYAAQMATHLGLRTADQIAALTASLIGKEYKADPEKMTQIANRVGETLSQPFGKAFGVTDTPGYQQEATNRALQYVGSQMEKGAETVSEATGLPKGDVLWMANAALPRVVEGIGARGKMVASDIQRAAQGEGPLFEVAAGLASPPLHAIKPKGGNWITSLGDPSAGQLGSELRQRKLPPSSEAFSAFNEWVSGPYAKYITNEMGTGAKTDTLVRLADQGIVLPEARAFMEDNPGFMVENSATARSSREVAKTPPGFTAELTARTPEGKGIENFFDVITRTKTKKDISDPLAEARFQNPDLPPTPYERLGEKTPIYDLLHPSALEHGLAPLDKVSSYVLGNLLEGRYRPDQVKNLSMERVVRDMVSEYDKLMKNQAKLINELPVNFQSEGSNMTWRNPVIPGNEKATADLHKKVGDDMGICIGQKAYYERALSGEAEHPVLFGKNGDPHVAIELRPFDTQELIRRLPESEQALLKERASIRASQGEDIYKAQNAVYKETYGEPPIDVLQIKGKANQAPDTKYLDEVANYLNSRPIGRVQETGGIVDAQNPRSIISFAQKYKDQYKPTEVIDLFNAAIDVQPDAPRFMTPEQFKRFLSPIGPPKMAKGGKVSFADNLESMRYELIKAA